MPPTATEPAPIAPTGAAPIAAWVFPAEPGAPTVLAIGDFTANGLWFGDLARACEGRIRFVAPDLRGRAASRTAPVPRALADHLGDLTGLLDRLDVWSVTTLGHGTGAQIVLDLASRDPSRVAAVHLLDGPARWPTDATDPLGAAALLDPGATRIGRTWAHRDAAIHEGIISGRLPRAGMSRSLRRAVDAEITGVGFGWQARLDATALQVDARSLAGWTPSPIPSVPVHLVRALHGHHREDPAFELWDLGAPVTTVDTTHTGLVSEPGAVRTVADVLLRIVDATLDPGPGMTPPNRRH